MSRQSLLVIYLGFRKSQKSLAVAFLSRLPASENLCDSWNANMWKDQHGHGCSYALARESRTVTQREEALK